MSTYEQLRGARLKFLDQDPANATDGQVWYNSTTGKDRVQGIGTGAWSSSSPTLNEFSYGSCSLQAAQTAGIFGAGGSNPKNKSESYDGTGYTSEANLTNARGNSECGGGGGTATTALCMHGTPGGGPIIANTEEYNGTTWSEIADLNQSRVQVSGAGTNTAAICFSGSNGPGDTSYNNSEEWNGTSWTEGNNLSSARRNSSGNGVQTSAISIGGVQPPGTVLNSVEEYDGTSWTAGTNYPSNIRGVGIIASTSTDAIGFGGNNPPSAIPAVGAKQYDGTSWTAVADLATTKQNPMAGGTTSAGLAVGGPGGSAISTTEEWNFSTTTITPAAWASGGNLSQARTEFAAAQNSTQNAGLVFGGFDGSTTIYNATEEYDGSAWSSGGNLPQGLRVPGGAGTQTAGLSVAGRNGPSPTARINNTYEYDGSTWTDGGNYPATQAYTGALGTQSTALAFGGENPSGTDLTTSNHYDGSTWTAGGTLNTAGYNNRGFGSSTSALCAFRAGPPTALETESYDGSTWTSVNSMNQNTGQGGTAGSYPNGIAFGGATPGTNTEGWDGTNWSTRPAMSTARRCEGFGTETAGVATGGETPSSPTSATTEEFTPESTTANPAQSLTTSS